MDTIKTWIESNLKDIALHDSFRNVTKIRDVNGKRLGEEMVVMVSDIYRCTLSLEKEGGETKDVNVIVKMEPQGPLYITLIKKFGFFETEIMMYENTLKTMEKLMLDMDIGLKDLPWPVCYFCKDNKLLIQDLNDLGYSMVPTQKYLDLDHISLVMDAIGKFHAMSAILLERKQLDADVFKPSLLNKKTPFIVNMYTGGLTRLSEVIRDYWKEPEWSSTPERLLKAVENVGDKLAEMYNTAIAKWDFKVLNHGDFSMKNLLFLYAPESEKPSSVKFVDFQACHFSSPARDLGMVLYSSVLPHIREQNMQNILKVYADSLSETFKKFNYNGKIPSLEEITAGLTSLSYWTAVMSLCSLPVFLSSNREDYKEEVEKFIEPEDKDSVKPKGVVSKAYYRIKIIEDALKYEVKRCMDANII